MLGASLVRGVVREVNISAESPYDGRLSVGDPLEKVLNVAFEAYRTRYAPLPAPTPEAF